MSWFRPLAATFALGLLAAALASCGFRPLYGGASGGETTVDLSAVAVSEIPGRVGYELRNSLTDRLAPEGPAPERRFELSATLNTAKRSLAIQSDETVTRYDLAVTVNFVLTEIATQKTLYKDSVKVETSYNVVNEDYSTLVSEKDAERRAAQQASEEIRTLLAVYFSRFSGR